MYWMDPSFPSAYDIGVAAVHGSTDYLTIARV